MPIKYVGSLGTVGQAQDVDRVEIECFAITPYQVVTGGRPSVGIVTGGRPLVEIVLTPVITDVEYGGGA